MIGYWQQTPKGLRRSHAHGQALAEFAMIAPILFLLLFGVIQLGLLFGAQNGLVDGVRNAARRAVTYRVNEASLTDPGILAAVCGAIETELDSQLSRSIPGFDPARLNPLQISYHWETNPGDDTDPARYFLYVQIQASYDNPIYVPLVGYVIHPSDPGTFPLSASEQMRIENPALPQGAVATYTCP